MAERITSERVDAKAILNKIKDTLKSYESDDEELHNKLLNAKDVYYTKTDGLKIVINSGLFGKLGDENSFLYDLRAMYEVTVNNQLLLMKLIEMLYLKGIDTISANTDGIICRIPRHLEDTYYEICKEWEELTKFKLEYNDYEKYVCYAVNDYMAISKGYKDTNHTEEDKSNYIKTKGLFLDKIQVDKGYKHPVVSTALIKHFADGVNVKEFIRNHDNIYDFCISIKTGKEFIKEYHYVEKGVPKIDKLPKNVRYYISNSGGMIMKRYMEPKTDKRGNVREYISLHSGKYSTLFNDYFNVDNFKDYNINYNHYIAECYKVINEINNLVSLKQKKRNYGGLFD